MTTGKRTGLYEWHTSHGANMAEFAGYDMPLWYPEGARAEHLAVINKAGLFDTSHMAVVLVHGPQSRNLLQHCFTKDLDRCLGREKTALVAGRCVYGVFLDVAGHVIDDAIVYQLDVDRYMVVVNAGMGESITLHLSEYNPAGDVVIEDWTDHLGKIDLQGPSAARILQPLLASSEDVFRSLPYFAYKGGFGPFAGGEPVVLTSGDHLLLSRTGYTGEFGFELFCENGQLEKIWQMVMEAGQEHGLLPCGLAARDSLRTGAVLPLSHQDIGDWLYCNHPWPFALPLENGSHAFTKSFLGAEKILAGMAGDTGSAPSLHTYPFAGFDPRKIPAGSDGVVLDQVGNRCGRILSCTTDMALAREDGEIVSVATRPGLAAKGLSCGFVLLEVTKKAGERVVLNAGKRTIEVEIREDIRPGRTARVPLSKML